MGNRILITGATGRVGGALVKLLMKADFELRIATRKPSKISEDLKKSVETVLFDYEDSSTFGPALKGVDKLFLIVRPGDNHSDAFAIPVIDEAKNAGVQHIVALTAIGVEQDETFMLRKLERHIEDSGIPFTHLRPNWFMQNFDSGFIHAGILKTSSINLPASDAKISFVDIRDIAEVAFAVLKLQFLRFLAAQSTITKTILSLKKTPATGDLPEIPNWHHFMFLLTPLWKMTLLLMLICYFRNCSVTVILVK